MTMPEMQKAISGLRLFLSEITRKEGELNALLVQFKRQLDRAPRHAIHGGNPLEATLNIMGEIQERLDEAERMRKHLANIKKQAEDELQALNTTDKIEQAKSEVASLKAQRGPGEEVDETRIKELERFIKEASIRAGEAITGNFNVPEL